MLNYLSRAATLLALLFVCAPATSQTIELLEVRQTSQIELLAALIGISNETLPIEHDVAMYRVTYPMTYLGQTYDVTGSLYLPVDNAGNAV